MTFLIFIGSLTEKEIYTTLLSIARERNALKTALNDAETAIGRLGAAITGVMWFLLIIAYFIIYGSEPGKVFIQFFHTIFAYLFSGSNDCFIIPFGYCFRHWQLN